MNREKLLKKDLKVTTNFCHSKALLWHLDNIGCNSLAGETFFNINCDIDTFQLINELLVRDSWIFSILLPSLCYHSGLPKIFVGFCASLAFLSGLDIMLMNEIVFQIFHDHANKKNVGSFGTTRILSFSKGFFLFNQSQSCHIIKLSSSSVHLQKQIIRRRFEVTLRYTQLWGTLLQLKWSFYSLNN